MKVNNNLFAEDINYFKTSNTSPDIWIDKAKNLIASIDGIVIAEGFGNDSITGLSAFMLRFKLDNNIFKLIWPVLPCKNKSNQRAAKIQAATFIYHDIKAKCMSSEVLGKRSSFFNYLELPDGRTTSQISTSELIDATISNPLLPKEINEE